VKKFKRKTAEWNIKRNAKFIAIPKKDPAEMEANANNGVSEEWGLLKITYQIYDAM
jgi:hypothetical protein